MSFAIHLLVVSTQNVRSSVINQHVHVFHLTKEIHSLAVVMSVTLITIADLKKLAVISNVFALVHNAVKAQLASLFQIIVQHVNVQKVTSDHLTLNVVQNVTAIPIVQDRDQLVSMEFVKIHVMALAELMLIVI